MSTPASERSVELEFWAERDERTETNKNPSATEDIPRPNGDPFELILRPLLERDTKQCEAWKDEVQNILIFSGLFSAVVTAFISESYQKLQPDPNDTIITLLSNIANQNNSTNIPASDSSLSPFVPAHSDIRINVFWFISLVLSLTVALVGIISLQWLREHQRYDPAIEPSKAFAIFNARKEGLERWYVPHIFAALPLLLQAALVLFLAGIIDLLFSLRPEVAIPVTAVAGIPSIFLLATTVLPTLQMYTMRLPYLLSVNYNVPAPCPYKSPQSLIFRRITSVLDSLFINGAWILAIFYLPIVMTRRFIQNLDPYLLCLCRRNTPSVVSPFKGSTDSCFRASQIRLTSSSGDWISADDKWLAARTHYSVITKTPEDCRGVLVDQSFARKTSVAPEFYDTVQGIQKASYGSHGSDTYTHALYDAGGLLIHDQLKAWIKDVGSVQPASDKRIRFMRGRIISVMNILGPDHASHSKYPPSEYATIRPGRLLPEMVPLQSVYTASLLQRLLASTNLESVGVANILHRWNESHIKTVSRSLLLDPEEIFKCTSTSVLAPGWFVARPAHYRNLVNHHTGIETRTHSSSRSTTILLSFINKSCTLPPWTSSCPHLLAPTTQGQCQINFFYENVDNFIRYIVVFQTEEDIIRTLAQLKDICEASPQPIVDRPFVVVIACAYINAVTLIERHRIYGFASLFQFIYSICGAPSKNLRPGNTKYAWEGLRFALEYIRSYQVQSETNQLRRASIARQDTEDSSRTLRDTTLKDVIAGLSIV